MRPLIAVLLSLSLFCLAAAPKPKVKLSTSLGVIVMELEPDAAPKTVENFLKYVKKGQYKGTIFHRVIPGFMIQGGGYVDYLGRSARMPRSPTKQTAPWLRASRIGGGPWRWHGRRIRIVPRPSFSSMWWTIRPWISREKQQPDLGLLRVRKVVQGMDVVDRIKAVKTSNKRSDFLNLPVKPVLITDATQIQ